MRIARRLANESNLNDGLERLVTDLTTLFRQRHYRGKPHSIVVAGWKGNGPDEPTAFSGLVSNHFRLDDKWLSSPNASFDWFVEMARPDLHTLVFVPHLMPRSAAVVLYRKLLNVKERGLNATNAVRLTVEAMHSVAEYRKAVDRDLMASILPRFAVPRGDHGELIILNRYVNPDAPTFWTISANGDWVEYGPTMIMNGIVLSNLQIRPAAREPN